MNRRWLGLVWLGLLGLVAIGSTAIAGGNQDPGAGVQTQVEEWQPGVRPGVTLDKQGLVQLVKDMTRVELDFKVHRDLKAADERLHELWLAASTDWISGPQWHLLIELAMARARLNVEVRRFELAGRHLDHLIFALPRSGAIARPVEELQAPSAELLLEEKKQLLDPRLALMRQEIAMQLDRARQGGLGAGLDREDPVVQTVLRLIEENNISTMLQMGTTVLPIVEEIALESMDELYENVSLDPLYWIQNLSGLRVPRVALAGLERGGVVWRFRVVRLLEEFGMTGLGGNASQRAEAAARWGAVLEKLLEDPRVTVAVLPYAVEVYGAGHRSAALENALFEAWQSPDRERRQVVLGGFEQVSSMDSIQPLLERVLASGRAEDRHLASRWLARNCDDMGSLRGCAEDPDPVIRQNLAYALERLVSRNGEVLGDENLDLLLTLAADEAALVRRRVVSLLDRKPRGPVPRQAYLTLACDPDPRIRRSIAGLSLDNDSDFLPPLYEILAADGDSEVVARVDQWCSRYLGENFTLTRRSEFVGVIAARLRNGAHPFTECVHASQRTEIYRRFFRQHEGADPSRAGEVAEVLARVALELDDVQLLEFLTTMDRNAFLNYPALELPRDLLSRLLARVVRKDDGIHPAAGLLEELSKSARVNDPSLTEVVWSLARNPGVDRHARVYALTSLASRRDPRCQAVIRELFKSEAWETRGIDVDLGNALHHLGRSLSRADRDRLATELIGDPGTSPGPLDPFITGAYGSAIVGDELAQRILERFFDGTEGGVPAAADMVDLALHTVAAKPTERDLERIVAALHQPERTYALVVRLGEVPDPRWLPLLGEALTSPWMTDNNTREYCAQAAAASLANHYSDEAAVILLEGMRHASSPAVRSACKSGLAQIREFRDEEERVFARRTAALDRDDAILDLIGLLEDSDPTLQAEAARGLATLGVVDALPRLIRLLRSEQETVRSAAREAIDRLNAVEKPPKEGD